MRLLHNSTLYSLYLAIIVFFLKRMRFTFMACVQKHDSPLWKKRLPIFVMYFIGASWIATAGAYRFLRTINYNNNKD